jgi:signal transduction histidine kinase
MATSTHRRQVLLFLAAILLPCAALVVFGVRLLVQERELAVARSEEGRRTVARQLGIDLASRLELIALQQAGAVAARPHRLGTRLYGDPVVAVVAQVSEGRLVLPWEQDPEPARSRDHLSQEPFSAVLAQAEGTEFGSRHPAEAVDHYREALRVAAYPVQAARARLFLARVLAKTGRWEQARAEYLRLLASPGVVDQHGIAFSLYASAQLLAAGPEDAAAVRQALHAAFFVDGWPAPAALHLIRDLAARLPAPVTGDASHGGGDTLGVAVTRELERTERVLALSRDLAGLGLAPRSDDSGFPRNRWVLYGSPPWLVGAVPARDEGRYVVVAIEAAPAFAAVEAAAARPGGLVGAIEPANTQDADGELLGADFPGLVVRFESADGAPSGEVGTVRRWFYLAGLALVIGVTLFGAYLLWRDVRREVQVAELRSRFVSAVSHELKTPLTAIRMFAETLQMGRNTDSRTHDEYLETIVNESERLTRLLNNVLDFSKIERGDKSYRRRECCLADIVRSTARAMEYPLKQQRFALNLEIEEGRRSARVDRDAIEQAILNLLDNAMKYSGDSRDVHLRLASENGEAVISVSDRGVGIAHDEQERIFERFYRARGADGGQIPGTGLGLTLVQHIAHAHGGRVTVRSEVGNGSTFSLHLPWEEDEP